jgi:hypothetical protein
VVDTHGYYTFSEHDRSQSPREIIARIAGFSYVSVGHCLLLGSKRGNSLSGYQRLTSI